MPLSEKIKEINALKNMVDQHEKLSDDVLRKINYKFRLEWNFTSNSMEGNSLTKQETRSVMVGNITVEGKPIKDVLEMKGHDEVISNILQIGKGELNISEKRIKEIHKAIVHEENKEKLEEVGNWKKNPNYLYNYKNERFDFAAPADVPDRMHGLINELNTRKQKIKDPIEAVELAFWFHLEYITIHPFYDGNGRTARILTNLILVSFGFPPIYIKASEKEIYYQYLADIQGYGGTPDLFYDFMCNTLIRSLEIVVNAIEGKDVEEADDVWKELSLIKAKLSSESYTKSPQLVYQAYSAFERNVLPKLKASLKKFSDLFYETYEDKMMNQYLDVLQNRESIFRNPFDRLKEKETLKIFNRDIYETEVKELLWKQRMFGLKGVKQSRDITVAFYLRFNTGNYELETRIEGKKIFSAAKNYGDVYKDDETSAMKDLLAKELLIEIKKHLPE